MCFFKKLYQASGFSLENLYKSKPNRTDTEMLLVERQNKKNIYMKAAHIFYKLDIYVICSMTGILIECSFI